ncbi:UDP-N-acetylmuramate--L-alanine ligase [Pseudofulvibacter geojedonensis]|uniref:UDP-N-acetylmuramate--L-alanine ligase n=1 Tax=Pseudofulvibacter geojedonensis TaxID=1123758 RepID=A0ABW3I0W3_9FLAO
MNLENIHSVYFVGIGGIGMSALARYFHSLGKKVAGYDKTPTAITKSLESLGVEIHFEDNLDLINNNFKDVNKTLVVYTPAIPNSHRELNYFLDNQFKVQKRAETLGLITKNSFCFAVAGTHGKTTTSSILGHLLKVCNANMTAFLGGITENYKSNLILNGSDISVVEADEFDRSFMKLYPDVACVTSMDADHLDIYGDGDTLEQTFKDFAEKLPNKNKLFVKKGLPLQGVTYGVNEGADYVVRNVQIKNGSYHFSIKTPKEIVDDLVFHLPGEHNLSNALVAFAMAYDNGFDVSDLRIGLDSFKGVERRFTYQIKTDDFVFIDDYAHHPTEIDAVHQAVREMYPKKEVMVVFQPHLFTRTQDFAEDFAKSLSRFDAVRLLDIYPARELPIEGVTSNWLLEMITNDNKKLIKKSEIITEIKAVNMPVFLTIGAGDIGAEVSVIKKELTN